MDLVSKEKSQKIDEIVKLINEEGKKIREENEFFDNLSLIMSDDKMLNFFDNYACS